MSLYDVVMYLVGIMSLREKIVASILAKFTHIMNVTFGYPIHFVRTSFSYQGHG